MRRGCPNELPGIIFSGVQDILAKFQLCADGAVCPSAVVVDFFRTERQWNQNGQKETNQQRPRSAAALFCSAVHSIALLSRICKLVANWIIARQYWIVKWNFLRTLRWSKSLPRGLTPSGPLSFCQGFHCFFLHPAESGMFSKLFVDTTQFLW